MGPKWNFVAQAAHRLDKHSDSHILLEVNGTPDSIQDHRNVLASFVNVRDPRRSAFVSSTRRIPGSRSSGAEDSLVLVVSFEAKHN